MMGIEELSEYNWLTYLQGGQQNYIYNIREHIKPILASNLIPTFTDHSIKHSDRIVNILGALLHDDRAEKEILTDAEVRILVTAAILHDVGLFIPKAHGYNQPIYENGERESEICLKNVELAYKEMLKISNFR
jgi:response regulator RpfG family c-di-GMP phosphodiesterase